jgi:ABC-type sugar transport system ATPase subunit
MSTDIQEQEKKEQQYQEHKKKNQQQVLIDWRRGQLIELISKGKNLTQIAETLKVDVSTISRDYQYIRENANSILKNFFVEILPLEATKCLSRLTSISNEAWKMAEQADKEGDMKTKAAALSLAQKAALDILKVVTDNHWLVDEAFKVRNKQGSESLNDKRERIQPIL